jgi:hypothetical protein
MGQTISGETAMTAANPLPGPMTKLVQSILQPGEVLLWTEREPQLRYLGQRLLRIFLYSLWTAIAALLAGRMILMNPGFLKTSFENMVPVLLPIILAGVGAVLLTREIVHPIKREPDIYAVTNRRALIISLRREPHIQSYGAEILPEIKVIRRKGGRGDILFEHNLQWVTDAEGRSTSQARIIGFLGVPAVDEVLKLMQRIDQANTKIFYTRHMDR